MNIIYKNEFWMTIFAFGLLYWLFNASVALMPVVIIPLLLAIMSKK